MKGYHSCNVARFLWLAALGSRLDDWKLLRTEHRDFSTLEHKAWRASSENHPKASSATTLPRLESSHCFNVAKVSYPYNTTAVRPVPRVPRHAFASKYASSQPCRNSTHQRRGKCNWMSSQSRGIPRELPDTPNSLPLQTENRDMLMSITMAVKYQRDDPTRPTVSPKLGTKCSFLSRSSWCTRQI